MLRAITVSIIVAMCAGCTSARISRSLTSGAIGCPQNEIEITNETASGVMGRLHNWEAQCRGKNFVCSYDQTTGVNCKEPLPK